MVFPFFILAFQWRDLFKTLPNYPLVKFDVTFSVPGKMAPEIERKVNQVVEKNFNGLNNLLEMESTFKHEEAVVTLIFKKGTDPGRSRLFIQEKLDRVKVFLPPEVKNIKLTEREREVKPHLILENVDAYHYQDLKREFSKWTTIITKSVPKIDKTSTIKVTPRIDLMNQHKVSLDQLGKALKITGLTYRLGSKKGSSYLLEGIYNNLEETKSIVVGARKTKPVRLQEVADINFNAPQSPSTVRIWIDQDRFSLGEVEDLLQKHFPKIKVRDPVVEGIFEYLKKPLVISLGALILQLIIFAICFQHPTALISVLILDIFYMVHSLFWTYFFAGEVAIFDWKAIFLNLTSLTFMWAILLARIRSYFIPSDLDNFIQRQLEQAILFSLVEFLPTFIFIQVIGAIASLPVLMGQLNFPSFTILLRSIVLLTPINLCLIVVMATFLPLGWTEKQGDKNHSMLSGFLTKKASFLWLVPVVILAGFTPWLWKYEKLGMPEIISDKNFDQWRGHPHHPIYYADEDKLPQHYKILESTKRDPIIHWKISLGGLKQIMGRDLQSFQLSLAEMSQEKTFSFLKTENDSFPLTLSAPVFDELTFGHLTLGDLKAEKDPTLLKYFAQPEIEIYMSSAFRGQLTRLAKGELLPAVTKYNFFHKNKDDALLPSPVTRFFFGEYENYMRNHWTVILFLFVTLSLYLNSFYRGAITTLFALIIWKIPGPLKTNLSQFFTLDNLWLTYLPLWTGLGTLLVSAKTVDIDRSRGNDKQRAVNQMAKTMSKTIIVINFFLPLFLAWWWFVEVKLLPDNFTSLIYEMGFIAILVVCATLLTFFLLFRLYYNTSEEFIDQLSLKLTRSYYKMKAKNTAKN
jgi:hypothetical protein